MALVGFKAQNHQQQVRRRGARPEVDNLETPWEFFASLDRRFGFTLDACALPHNAKCERYFGPPDLSPAAYACMWDHPDECGPGGCANCPHKKQAPLSLDGLAQSWAGERVWCNPPYSDIRPWVSKAHLARNAELVVMLVPANRTEQAWWQDLVEPYRDGGRGIFAGTDDVRVEFLPGRLRFIKHGHDRVEPNQRPPFGCCLLIWGQEAA